MKLRRITINLDHGRRIVLDPEGGMNLEVWLTGMEGWYLDNDAEAPDLEDILQQATELCRRQADNARIEYEPEEMAAQRREAVPGWTVEEILRREG